MMTTVEFAPLKSAITGSVFSPRDPEYDDARSIWNGQIDHRPAVIARCRSASDVSVALAFARAIRWRSRSEVVGIPTEVHRCVKAV